MASLIEELRRREAAARQELDELRGEIARLSERLARAEERLARLEVTRETVTEILGDAVASPTWTISASGGATAPEA
jgi:chromosome segregation ATPase